MIARTRRPTSTAVLVPVVLAAGLGLSACGEKTLKTGEIEDTISKQFARQGLAIRDVACKDGVEAKVDSKVECTGRNQADTRLIIEGKVTAVKDDKASFGVRVVRGIAKGSVVANDVRARLERQQGQSAKGMTCPDEVTLPTPKPITCVLTTDDGKQYDTKVSISGQNRISYEVARTPR